MRRLVPVLALVLAFSAGGIDAAPACQASVSSIWVNVRSHVLSLCENGKAVRIYPVALGWGGIGKRRAGDHKTPLGVYGLGQPRPSEKYGTFVPIAYPSPGQELLGFTGTAIGIHGPPRGFLPLSDKGQWIDWTDGCVAVPTDSDVEEIATWALKASPLFVEIE